MSHPVVGKYMYSSVEVILHIKISLLVMSSENCCIMSLVALEGALSSLNKITEVTSTVYLAWGLHTVHKAWATNWGCGV